MKRIKIIFKLAILAMTLTISLGTWAQSSVKVGDNRTTINSSAQLEIESTAKGLLPPRMTTAQRNAIANPATGLVLFNTTVNCIQVNIGTPAAPVWQCSSGINPSTGGTGDVTSLGGAPCSANSIAGAMATGVPVSGVTMTVYVNVTQLGTWNITAGPTNGVTFSGSGIFTTTGCQSIILTASGTPTVSGSTTWTTNTTPSGSASATVAAISPTSGGTSVVSAWTSPVGCSVGAGKNNSPAGTRRGGVNETMVQGTPAPSTATITLNANVTSIGSYNISTNTVNGVTFSASGIFGGTGIQAVTLTPTGTPTLAGNFIWVINVSSFNVYGSVLTVNAPLGSSYDAHFNGIISGAHVGTTWQNATQSTGETFNNNTFCQNKPISAQGCGGLTSVIASSGRVHPTVNINGQCWIQTNLKTVPSVYNNYTDTTYWTTSSPGDQGYWGYYNTNNTGGTVGWLSTEPATEEGLLYQWCGAMNATISERSRGICPAGFHIPSDCEWMYLEHGQGMSIAEQIGTNYRASISDNQGTPGNKLRFQGTGFTNASSFKALLPGMRAGGGTAFTDRSAFGVWWTSSANNSTNSGYRLVASGSRGVYRINNSKASAYSVRCLKD